MPNSGNCATNRKKPGAGRQRAIGRASPFIDARLVSVVASLLLAIPMAAMAARVVRESADGAWQTLDGTPVEQQRAEPWVRPAFFQPARLDVATFRNMLREAPLEFTREGFERPLIIELPTPDGTFGRFEVVESPIMEPGLAAQFPEIKTYAGQGVTDPTATLRFDMTPQGFHGQVLSADGSFYIDPFSRGDATFYASYDKRDLAPPEDGWNCLTPDSGGAARLGARGATPGRGFANRSGTFLQTYRTAVAATVEYTAFHGGTVALGQAAIVTAINRVTGVYEREMSIRLTLVANNSLLVHVVEPDSYTNNNGSTMLGQNQTNVDGAIGNANYDIGHVFSTGGGAIAGLGVTCATGQKARGVTGSSIPTGDAFWIDKVAHEMGHQFGANHCFNSSDGSCGGGARVAAWAYEPGSGSTIMAFAGACGASNLQSNNDDYFSHGSFDQILAFITNVGAGGCPTDVANGNTAPLVNAGPDYTIPIGTPFELTPASYSDAEGNAMTFCWEQRDLGSVQVAVGGVIADNGNAPFIRSFPPALSPTRVIPRISDLIANTFVIGEALPGTNRNINFRLTIRDNRSGGGGVNTDDIVVTSTTSAGPFLVTAPNAGGSFTGSTTVTWNVASTNSGTVNCASVDIYLSTDGGNTFPTLLLGGTPNDGSEVMPLPAISTSTARIKVKGDGNIFFDISNADFSITTAPIPGLFNLTSPTDGATDQPVEPTLAWSASSGAVDYTVTVDTDSGFTPPFIYQASTVSTSITIPPATLINSTSYYWRVVANNGAGSTSGSPALSLFTTEPVPLFCVGDANGDGFVNFADVTSVLVNFGLPCP